MTAPFGRAGAAAPSPVPGSWTVRDARPDDAPFLADMLAVAADWRPGAAVRTSAAVLGQPGVGHYVSGWPRPGDTGVVAHTDRPIGAAWYRFLPASDPGYGHVDPDTPEITVGVAPEHRGLGVGRALLEALLRRAAAAGLARVSLSVEDDNPARHLYARLGFAPVGHTGNSTTMVRTLARGPAAPGPPRS